MNLSLKTRNAISVVVIAALSAAALLGIYKVLFGPGGDGYLVRAEFKDAGGLTKNSDVKIGGVAGGRVRSIELTDRDTALVTMDLKREASPIGRGAKAASRPVNLLGEKYIDLDAGDLKQPLESGAELGLEKTSRPVELDDVLNVLQPDVRARMRILINEAGISMAGRSADFNATLDALPPALDQSQDLIADFSADDRRLKALIEQSDRVLASFVSKDGDLQDLVDSAKGTLAITASKRKELAATLQTAPGTLSQLNRTLGELESTSEALLPTARLVRQAAPPLRATLERLPAFAKDATPTLAQLERTAPSITRLGLRARPTVRRLSPTLKELETFSRRLDPLATTLDGGVWRKFLGLMNSWSLATGRSDGLGKVFRLQTIIDKQIVTSALQRFAGTPANPGSASRTRRPTRDAAPGAPSAPGRTTTPAAASPPSRPKVPVGGEAPVVGRVVDEALESVRGILGGSRDKPAAPATAPAAGGEAGTLFDYLFGG
jgi:phospholipid/cholesterol/gamma-HCH transport system substrate-binding protein